MVWLFFTLRKVWTHYPNFLLPGINPAHLKFVGLSFSNTLKLAKSDLICVMFETSY